MCNHISEKKDRKIHAHGHHGILHSISTRSIQKQTINSSSAHNETHNKMNRQKLSAVCFTCGKINPIGEEYCRNCGAKIYKCPISNAPFSEGDEFIQCPHCNSIFHAHHFEIWSQNNTNCPYCSRPLEHVKKGIIGINYFEAPPLA